MKTVKNILDKITSYASVFIFIMMVLMVTYQVIARYIFSAPSSVTEILTRYAFVWLIIISATYDGVGAALEEEAKANTKPLVWQNIILLLGAGLLVSALSMELGTPLNKLMPVFDSSTWTVLVVTVLGILFALTPFGKIKGTEEISNVMLYIVIALIASRADLSAVGNAPIWLLAGFVILVIHVVIMIILAKVLKMDIFTCCVASLANIGGTATAPVLAGAYSTALVPVGIIMALLGYVIGTGGGLIVANIMSLFG